MKKRTLLILLPAVFLLSCHQADKNKGDPFSTGTEDYLNDSRSILDSLFNHRDAHILAQLFEENAVCLFGSMDELKGRSTIEKTFDQFFESCDSLHIRSKVNEIMAQDKWALERSVYSLVYRKKGGLNLEYSSGRIVTSFQKNKGRWEIMWQITNISPIGNMDSVMKPVKEYY